MEDNMNKNTELIQAELFIKNERLPLFPGYRGYSFSSTFEVNHLVIHDIRIHTHHEYCKDKKKLPKGFHSSFVMPNLNNYVHFTINDNRICKVDCEDPNFKKISENSDFKVVLKELYSQVYKTKEVPRLGWDKFCGLKDVEEFTKEGMFNEYYNYEKIENPCKKIKTK